ncbi:hypothetical protein HY389_01210 [Candidatus Daviesbacteria bacterium]|nr:hypothetical protein [Candidatus Daviesbacteria bacterium]
MEKTEEIDASPVKTLSPSKLNRIFLGILIGSVVLGVGAGYFLSRGSKVQVSNGKVTTAPKTAQQDTKTFRDFAEGVIKKNPPPKDPTEYVEGTHLLVRDNAQPVALTSSVVDLSQYEGKKVKVFGETQKAIKAGWLMDVGKVEVE